METIAHIGNRVEMFVDEWLTEKMKGVELKLHPPQRKEIVLTLDRPWEGDVGGYFTVLQERDKVRLYYRGNLVAKSSADPRQVTCYAESADGIHFERPSLGLYEFAGSTDNNIVWQGMPSHNLAPFRDDAPDALPDERYKAVGGVGKLFGFVSEDGIHWRIAKEEPIMTDGPFDSLNTVLWDPNRRAYRCFSRLFRDRSFRDIETAVSADFRAWGTREPFRYNDDMPFEHYYTNAVMLCPGAEHMYLAFPMRYVPERKKRREHPIGGISDAVFMSSRDGLHWDRTFREAWCRPGIDPQNWTDRNLIVATGCAQLSPDELSFYMQEHFRWPDTRLRRLTVRKHGFGSVHADFRGGEFVTKPFRFEGNTLLLNYATSAAGFIQAELQDEHGRPLEGFELERMDPLYGDEVEGRAVWRADASSDANADAGQWNGKPVRLRFRMQDADLYAIRWTNKTTGEDRT